MSRKSLVPLNLPVLPVNPTFPTPQVGDLYLNSNDSNVYVYNETGWTPLAGGGGGGGAGTNLAWWLGESN